MKFKLRQVQFQKLPCFSTKKQVRATTVRRDSLIKTGEVLIKLIKMVDFVRVTSKQKFLEGKKLKI
jgi:hypothetical protein